jgi:hypothetical protein
MPVSTETGQHILEKLLTQRRKGAKWQLVWRLLGGEPIHNFYEMRRSPDRRYDSLG